MAPEVARLASIRARFDRDAEREKRRLMEALARTRIRGRRELLLLHETALFLAAYPDSAAVRALAEAELARFAERVPAGALDETGVAGSAIHCSMSLSVVAWLAERYPGAIELWEEGEGWEARLDEALLHLLPEAELEALADGYLDARRWHRATRAGTGVLGRLREMIDALEAAPAARRALWAALDLPVAWTLGAESGSRTLNRAPSGRPAFQRRPFQRRPVQLLRELRKANFPFEQVSERTGARWVDAARAAVAARLREMYSFMHGNPRDVTVFRLERGVELGLIGVVPEARLPVRTFYGYLLARNGVPIGYGDAVLAFEWGEINFHIYETFRQAESAAVYAGVVRALHQHLGVRYLFLNRYQFGWHNEDAIRSGAFWFYEKLGFRPRSPALLELWRRERQAIDADPAHRTAPRELRALAREHMALALTRDRDEAARLHAEYARFHPAALGTAISRRIEAEHDGSRRAAREAWRRRVARVLPPPRDARERAAWERRVPVLALLPDLEAWTARELEGLRRLITLEAGERSRAQLVASRSHHRLRLGACSAAMNVGGEEPMGTFGPSPPTSEG